MSKYPSLIMRRCWVFMVALEAVREAVQEVVRSAVRAVIHKEEMKF